MRILVAEDERNLNRILTEALTDEGYSVDPCFDGQEAWDALACAEYDVLVLDKFLDSRQQPVSVVDHAVHIADEALLGAQRLKSAL